MIEDYGLDGVNTISVDDISYQMDNLKQNKIEKNVYAFDNYPVVLFDDDKPEVKVMFKPMSNLEVDAFIKKKEAAM